MHSHILYCIIIIIIIIIIINHLISGINAWDVGVVRYSAGIMDRTVEELVSMNRKILVALRDHEDAARRSI